MGSKPSQPVEPPIWNSLNVFDPHATKRLIVTVPMVATFVIKKINGVEPRDILGEFFILANTSQDEKIKAAVQAAVYCLTPTPLYIRRFCKGLSLREDEHTIYVELGKASG